VQIDGFDFVYDLLPGTVELFLEFLLLGWITADMLPLLGQRP